MLLHADPFLHRLETYIRLHGLLHEGSDVLVAVSGGLDSMVLLHALAGLGYQVQAAHVNYRLRGAESDADESLVTEVCAMRGWRLYKTSFDTEEIARSSGATGIQELARSLRYEWFGRVLREQHIPAVATAHHSDDQAETILWHFIRGSGAAGLRGMLPQNGNLIRPLLEASRDEITAFAQARAIPYREDASNQSLKYSRNRIRHELIPLLESIHPGTRSALLRSVPVFRQLEQYSIHHLDRELTEMTADHDQASYLSYTAVKSHPAPALLLHHWLAGKGFNQAQITGIAAQITRDQARPGSRYFSHTHELLADRSALILVSRTEAAGSEAAIVAVQLIPGKEIMLPDGSTLRIRIPAADEAVASGEHHHLLLPGDLAGADGLLRRWRSGDRFCPAGMNGLSKKLSDLMTDLKLDGWQKRRAWVLEIGGRIAWLPGIRADERFALSPSVQAGNPGRPLLLEWSPAPGHTDPLGQEGL